MITEQEQHALDRVREQEGDFYAELMTLALIRTHPDVPTERIAETVLGVYHDLNERVLEE